MAPAGSGSVNAWSADSVSCINCPAGSYSFALFCSAALGRCVGGVQLRAYMYALPRLLLQNDWAPSMMHSVSMTAPSRSYSPMHPCLQCAADSTMKHKRPLLQLPGTAPLLKLIRSLSSPEPLATVLSGC